jgi:nucleoside transporter
MDPRKNKEHARLCALFFLHAHALGLWGVNFSNVLKAYGFERIVPFAFACSSIAALISPLAVGALADQRMAPERVLRWLGTGSAIFLVLLYYGIGQRWHVGWILVLAQVHALWSVPTFGLTTSLILSRLHDQRANFGPVRLWATLGWMSAGWVVSWVLQADASTLSGFAASAVWLLTVSFCFTLPPSKPNGARRRHSVREIFGLDALQLLRHHDHGIVFITAALLNMVLAVFYPFTPLHLEDLGVGHVTAVMSVGQITEGFAMLGLAALMQRFRLKWVFLSGIGVGVMRYALFALNTKAAVIAGIFLHGFCFTLFVITAQIYLERRVDSSLRARAQALLTLMMSGFGNLAGTLGGGWWRASCQQSGHTDWRTFWLGMTIATAGVMIFFALAYRGQQSREKHK